MSTLVALVLLGVGQIIVDDFPVATITLQNGLPPSVQTTGGGFQVSPVLEKRWCYVHNHWVVARRWTNGLGEVRFTKVRDVTPASRPYWYRNNAGYEQWGPVYYSAPRVLPTYRSNYVMGGGTWGTWTNFRPTQTYYRTSAPRYYGGCPGGICR